MNDFLDSYDVVVIGAGMTGSACALEFASSGAHVLLLESTSHETDRFAGEWIHPPGAAALRRLGVRLDQFSNGHGFVVYPPDHSTPIQLPYPAGAIAVSSSHGHLVKALRSTVDRHPLIQTSTGSRVTAVNGTAVTFLLQGIEHTAAAGRCVVMAHGRSSMAGSAAQPHGRKVRLSRLAGVLLTDVELPREGFGHVFLGGPGPVLLYRIATRTVRVSLDVPLSVGAGCGPGFLDRSYSGSIPEPLREVFRRELQMNNIQWAVNYSAARTSYGAGFLAFAGDAAGLIHPLTASGISLALGDAQRLAAVSSVESYSRIRRAESRVPEMLASALYQIFSSKHPGDAAVVAAMFSTWRSSAKERNRTIDLVSTENVSLRAFSASFLKVMATVSGDGVLGAMRAGRWRSAYLVFIRLMHWVAWVMRQLFTRHTPACEHDQLQFIRPRWRHPEPPKEQRP